MAITSAWVGEDVPIRITYDDGATDPDDTNADGVPDAAITITAPDGTEPVSAVAMTHVSVGVFEYVWDTAGLATGEYRVEVTAEFSAETKIAKSSIELRD